MSHFITVVRIPGSVKQSDLENELYKRLIPYYEYGTSEERDKDVKPYLEWHDTTDEFKNDYETDTTGYVRLPDGTECSAYEERFRNPNVLANERYLYPLGTEKFNKPVKEVYATFEEYCREYQDTEPNAEGRYGYWQNPNRKWDWYSIGGRWTGYFPVKATARTYAQSGRPGVMTEPNRDKAKADVVRIKDIDMDSVVTTMETQKIKFWEEWQQWLNGAKFGIFDGPRDVGLDIGLVQCKDETELTDDERTEQGFKLVKWERDTTPPRYDVIRLIEREDLDKYTAAFCKIAGYARLDDDHKWQAPGQMGWFGCSSDTPTLFNEYKNSALDWYQQGDQNDWVIAVDCHI